MRHDILHASLAAALAGALLLPVTLPKNTGRDAHTGARRFVTLSERLAKTAPSLSEFRSWGLQGRP